MRDERFAANILGCEVVTVHRSLHVMNGQADERRWRGRSRFSTIKGHLLCCPRGMSLRMHEHANRMDKSVFSVAALSDPSDERQFWRAATPYERLRALEYLREIMYGYDPASARLQRLLEVTQIGSD